MTENENSTVQLDIGHLQVNEVCKNVRRGNISLLYQFFLVLVQN